MPNELRIALKDSTQTGLRGQRRTIQPALVQFSLDLAAIILALTCACLAARWLVDGMGWPIALPTDLAVEAQALAVVLLALPSAKSMAGLYPGYGITLVERLRRQVLILAWTGLGVVLVDAYVNDGRWGWVLPLLSLTALAFFVFLADTVSRKVLQRLGLWGRPCLVVGAGDTGADVVRRLKRHPHLGFNPVLFVDEDAGKWGSTVEGLPVVAPAALGTGALLNTPVSIAVLAVPHIRRERLKGLIEAMPFKTVLMVPDLAGFETLNTRVRDIGGLLSLEFNRHLRGRIPGVLKRGFDIVGAFLLLVMVAPLMLFLALAVKLDSPGPVLFRQKRWAGGARAFDAVKFRTMHVDAETRLQELLAQDAELRREYETYHKLSRDPRITRVGRILRKLSFDELPQLWNVLAGDMSLIGPRPYMPHELAPYPAEKEVLARVRPGITGLWQVSGRHRTTFDERIGFDVFYVENYSIWLDLYILMRTVVVVLKADGA